MEDINNRKFVGRLVYSVLTSRRSVREAIALFPDSMDKNIECAYHALVHYEADEDLRCRDESYKEEQNNYLEFVADTLDRNNDLPKNIINNYKKYYSSTNILHKKNAKVFFKSFFRFLNLQD